MPEPDDVMVRHLQVGINPLPDDRVFKETFPVATEDILLGALIDNYRDEWTEDAPPPPPPEEP